MQVRKLTLAIAVALSVQAQADTFTVTNTSNAGSGSLRQAVDDANNNPGADEIVFAAGLGPIVLTSGQLTASETLDVIGPTAGQIISGNGQSRVIGLITEAATLSLRNLIITDGQTTVDAPVQRDCGPNGARGGAVCAVGALVLANSTVSNSSTSGAGAVGGGVYTQQAADFSDCTLSGNSTTGSNARGGAVFLRSTGTLQACTISSNTTAGQDAGGGGMYADDGINLLDSVVSSNQVLGDFSYGAGLFERNNADSATITNSVIRDNTSNVFYGRGGGAYLGAGAVITASTISGNSTQGNSSRGGGLVLTADSTLINTTVSGNSTAGFDSEGGGIYQRGGTLDVSNSTIIGNTASGGGGGIDLVNRFGAANATLNLDSTFLAGNQAAAGNFEAQGDGNDTLTVNASFSVFGDPAAEVNGTSTSVIFDDSLTLGMLGDNGCTQPAGAPGSQECVATRTIPAGSPLLDAGDNPLGLVSDQRGADFPRVLGVNADIGAIEFVPQPMISLLPEALDFGEVAVGETSAPFQVTINSTGAGMLEISAIDAVTAPFARSGGSCPAAGTFMLPGGNNCTIAYQFSPIGLGMATQTIAVTSNAVSGPGSFALIGDGVAPELTVNPVFIDFGNLDLGAPAVTQALELQNTGVGDLVINTITFEGSDADDFGLNIDNCSGVALAFGLSCMVEIRFDPVASGVKTAALNIDSNDPLAPALVPLSGSLDVEFADGFESSPQP